MNCKKAESFLVEYLYQELSAAKTVDVEKHLQTCDRCTKTLESWRAIHGGFQNSDYPEAAPYLKQKILVAARQELSRKPSFLEQFSFILKPVFIAPVMILALLASFYPSYKSWKSSQIAMSPSPQQPKAALESTGNRSDKPEPGKAGSYEYAGTKQEEERQEQNNVALTDESRLRDSVGKEEKTDLLSKKMKTAQKRDSEFDQQNRQDPASDSDDKESVARAHLQAESSPPAPASKPAEPAPKDYQESTGGLIYKSQAAEKQEVTFERAQVLFKNNELSRGKDIAEQAIGQDKSKALASQFHQAGIQYQKEHETDKAILQFSLLLKNYPDYAGKEDVLLRLGDSYRELGNYEEAQKIYQQLLALQPSNKTAAERLMLLNKRKQSEDQLRSLGYVEDPE